MAAQNKIIQYGLGDRVSILSLEGKSTRDIAAVINRERPDIGGISQRTVARYLAATREQRAQVATQIVAEHIAATVPADLELLEKAKAFFANIFLQVITGAVGASGATVYTHRDRVEAWHEVKDIIALKFRHIGVSDGGEDLANQHPTDLSKYKRRQEEEAANG